MTLTQKFLPQVIKTEGDNICKEVRDLETKEMPLEEKYDKLLDQYLQTELMNYALHKQL